MINDINKRKKSLGFTIVELLVVIVVIGIITTIVIVSYGGISKKAIEATLSSDLANASKQLEMHKAVNGVYPTANNCPTPGATEICLSSSPGNKLAYESISSANPPTYNLTGTNTNGSTISGTSDGKSPVIDPIALSAPTNLTAVAASSATINLSWNSVSGAVYYNLQQSSNSTFSTVTTIATQSATSFIASGLTAGTTYYFRVNATPLSGGASAWSSTANTTTNSPGTALYYYNKYNVVYSNSFVFSGNDPNVPPNTWPAYMYSSYNFSSITGPTVAGVKIAFPTSIGQTAYEISCENGFVYKWFVVSSNGANYNLTFYKSSLPSKGTLVTSNIVAADNTYPNDGFYQTGYCGNTDHFWYVKGARAN